MWPELSIPRLMKEVSLCPAIMRYLPEYTEGARYIDRAFFWKVLHAAKPNYASQLVQDAIRLRAEANAGPAKKVEKIKIK